ncbi:hypothetical protein Pint_10050 [Pistacia integerrima]|uniref:Uncharacterized protein n=1 Tax=Pistacia integerrima TaxID=434235 RepID=A0ACC0XK29_9ROSI|nr:hypothetical protein Pint_10050 [Pistacia integerrima]
MCIVTLLSTPSRNFSFCQHPCGLEGNPKSSRVQG